MRNSLDRESALVWMVAHYAISSYEGLQKEDSIGLGRKVSVTEWPALPQSYLPPTTGADFISEGTGLSSNATTRLLHHLKGIVAGGVGRH